MVASRQHLFLWSLGARAVRMLLSRYSEVYRMGEPIDTEGRQGRSRPVRLMLADNHAMFRQSVASMLSSDGEVEVVGDADNGPQAIEIAKQTRPEVIIMQVEREPEEAATEIRGMLEASPDSRVVVLTVHQDPTMVRRMAGLGTSA
jgi:AmiR/NasT family two-component response regulator